MSDRHSSRVLVALGTTGAAVGACMLAHKLWLRHQDAGSLQVTLGARTKPVAGMGPLAAACAPTFTSARLLPHGTQRAFCLAQVWSSSTWLPQLLLQSSTAMATAEADYKQQPGWCWCFAAVVSCSYAAGAASTRRQRLVALLSRQWTSCAPACSQVQCLRQQQLPDLNLLVSVPSATNSMQQCWRCSSSSNSTTSAAAGAHAQACTVLRASVSARCFACSAV